MILQYRQLKKYYFGFNWLKLGKNILIEHFMIKNLYFYFLIIHKKRNITQIVDINTVIDIISVLSLKLPVDPPPPYSYWIIWKKGFGVVFLTPNEDYNPAGPFPAVP